MKTFTLRILDSAGQHEFADIVSFVGFGSHSRWLVFQTSVVHQTDRFELQPSLFGIGDQLLVVSGKPFTENMF